jgi:3-oxoacyl-[acyl-carrier-protein] synthase II
MVRDGYADACLAGGAEACVGEVVMGGFANMRALSLRNDDPAAASRPFDADRDGFVLGEGAAILVLEPLHDALERGARIYAEVRGYGQSNDAHHMTAPDPSGAGAATAIRQALSDAGMQPDQVDYVNAHATATRLADSAETAAVKAAFGEHSLRLAISSTKSMTGHLLGAAGAVEAALTALAVQSRWVPPTINLLTPDPQCDLDYVPGVGRARRVDVALSNSFAFGGHNSSLVLCRESL